jgi:hypothetical protein
LKGVGGGVGQRVAGMGWRGGGGLRPGVMAGNTIGLLYTSCGYTGTCVFRRKRNLSRNFTHGEDRQHIMYNVQAPSKAEIGQDRSIYYS